MKQGGFKALSLVLSLILLAGMTGSTVFGDSNTVDYKSIVLEDFGGSTTHEWTINNRTYTYDYGWSLDASQFASVIDGESFPKMAFADSWPQALYGANRNGDPIYSLGIWGKFDRTGYNWIDIYPSNPEDGTPFEIPIPGRASTFDTWIWGANHNFYIEIYVRDYRGVVHEIYLGSLAYQGWKNLQVKVPTTIPQSKAVLPHLASLSFVKFRVWTQPGAHVDNFYLYMNHFKVLTDVFETLIDGDDLADPARLQEIWQ